MYPWLFASCCYCYYPTTTLYKEADDEFFILCLWNCRKAHWAVGLLETLTKETSEEGMPFGVLNACEVRTSRHAAGHQGQAHTKPHQMNWRP